MTRGKLFRYTGMAPTERTRALAYPDTAQARRAAAGLGRPKRRVKV